MAELSRCGRRKQRNPRRKDAQDEDGAGAVSEHLDTETRQEESMDKQSSGDDCHSDKEQEDESPIPKSDSESGDMNIDTDAEREEQGGEEADDASLEDGSDNGGNEDDRIQELMSRSDTAVIFPEPVSDQEDGANNNNNKESAGDTDEECPLKCPHCDRGVTHSPMLRDHIREEHGDKISKYSCPKCNASFLLKSQLEKHLAYHSPTSQICKVCHKTFANVYRLQRHMISHDESSDLRKFKCPECGKAFKFKHHLKEHIRIHSGEKPFECPNCGKRFSHSGSYSSHMTSKKCWVSNSKIRKPEKPQDDVLRPLVPKIEDGGVDLTVSSIYANQFPNFGQQMALFDPNSAHLLPHLVPHLNGIRPFLHYGPYAGHVINHMIPPLTAPGAYNPMLIDSKQAAKHFGKISGAENLIDINSNMPSNLSPKSKGENKSSKEIKKPDVNQNTESGPEQKDSQDAPVPSQDAAAVSEYSKSETSEDGMDRKAQPSADVEENTDAIPSETEESTQKDADAEENETCSQEGHSDEEEPNKNGDLAAVKKILEIVDATVSQQAQSRDDKRSISKLTKAEEISSLLTTKAAKEALQQHLQKSQSGQCRYCNEAFKSPVDLHQHERYLCKENKEIQSLDHSRETHNGLTSPDVASLASSRTDEDEIDDDDSFLDKDGHRVRVRSLIGDEQLALLNAHYDVNPRPRKYELIRIGNEIGLSKRVVQVWFQNRRARDRRKGKEIPYFPTMARQDRKPNGETVDSASSKGETPYIPVVPQLPFNGNSQVTGPLVFYAPQKINGQIVNAAYATPAVASNMAYTLQMEPLDLSTKKQPVKAHMDKPFSHTSPKPPGGEEVLDLSRKDRKQDSGDVKLRESAIYKYMQQEGMIPGELQDSRFSPSQRGTPQPQLVNAMSRGHTPIPMNGHSRHTTPEPHRSNTNSAVNTPERPTSCNIMTSTPRHATSPSMLPPRSPSTETGSITPPPSSLESSFNSSVSLDSVGLEHAMNGLHGKLKRARKKSWRQVGGDVEADEVQMEFDDALMIDEEFTHRKKRKSWKHHKIDVEEGMYACDQCDKIFSKQSSLARHKYEHSGQRPFSCDICGKAFKHKHHLTEHKRLHSGEKPFQCKKCGKRFSHSGSYSQHMNHRYKYCKPTKMGEVEEDDEDCPLEVSPSYI